MAKSIFYQSPWLYQWGLKVIHGVNFGKRYKFMASFAQKGNLVLEPGCGPAILAQYLPKNAFYRGFDTNKDFVDYAIKKGRVVKIGNVLDRSNYCPADLVVACDILHHLAPSSRKSFIKNCFESCKNTFILCEPGHKTNGEVKKLSPLKKALVEWSEQDGTGNFKLNYFLTQKKLLGKIKNGFGVIPRKVERKTYRFGQDLVAVFYKKAKLGTKFEEPKTVTAIIPVFNEERTLAKVIQPLLSSCLFSQVICVNDGSTDKSLQILKTFNTQLKVLNFKRNYGKGHALAAGIRQANSGLVAFFDADLVNLTQSHIQDLLNPVIRGKARAVLGCRGADTLMPRMFTTLAGERVYYRQDLLPNLKKLSTARFGAEILLNNLVKGKKTAKVSLKGLKSLYKYQKRKPAQAVQEYLNEAVEIAQEIGRREVLLPSDKEIIRGLAKVTNLVQLREKIKALQSKKLKLVFSKYVLKYLKILKKWWNES